MLLSNSGQSVHSMTGVCCWQCCEMLDCLGIPYVQSSGEAEAMCAVLNSHGVGHYSDTINQLAIVGEFKKLITSEIVFFF